MEYHIVFMVFLGRVLQMIMQVVVFDRDTE